MYVCKCIEPFWWSNPWFLVVWNAMSKWIATGFSDLENLGSTPRKGLQSTLPPFSRDLWSFCFVLGAVLSPKKWKYNMLNDGISDVACWWQCPKIWTIAWRWLENECKQIRGTCGAGVQARRASFADCCANESAEWQRMRVKEERASMRWCYQHFSAGHVGRNNSS